MHVHTVSPSGTPVEEEREASSVLQGGQFVSAAAANVYTQYGRDLCRILVRA